MTRTAELTRLTKETDITVRLSLDGGDSDIMSGVGFFDHMLEAMARYSGFGIFLRCEGDLHIDAHHSVEDCGIVFGRCLKEALGDKLGIRRFAHCYIPMDEALCFAAIDISGRAYLHYEADMPQEHIGNYESCLTREFFRAVANAAGLTLHLRVLYGDNAHHITEALFKAFGICLKEACEVSGSAVPSTKGVLD